MRYGIHVPPLQRQDNIIIYEYLPMEGIVLWKHTQKHIIYFSASELFMLITVRVNKLLLLS